MQARFTSLNKFNGTKMKVVYRVVCIDNGQVVVAEDSAQKAQEVFLARMALPEDDIDWISAGRYTHEMVVVDE